MLKRTLPFLALPLLAAGCATTFTNLTPHQEARKTDNFYPVEVALHSDQQTLRWNSIQPHVVVDNQAVPLRQTPYMTNRWEGLMPVSPDRDVVKYHYRFDYEYDAFGKPKVGTLVSPDYTLRIK